MAWAVRLRMACSGLLHGVTAGCVLPSFDTRQLRQCENRQSLFSSNYPWYDALRFLVSREVCADVSSSAPTEQRNQNITAGRRWCSCNYAVMSTGVCTRLLYNLLGERFKNGPRRRFNDHSYITCNVPGPCNESCYLDQLHYLTCDKALA